MEHTEDLGRTKSGDDPASIWQLQRIRQLETGSVLTGAMFQCHHGASSSKPTRWMGNVSSFADSLYLGWPCFNDNNQYAGPLPSFCGHERHQPLI
eukprot:5410357-Karenia_brevis.AAC.1